MTSLSPQSESACPQPEPGMASSTACSNTLPRMCYSTGQGACQQHANTTGDPPFQVGKTRLCSSTHSLPPTAATHMHKLPSTTISPFLLGQERSWEHQSGSSQGVWDLFSEDQTEHHTRQRREENTSAEDSKMASSSWPGWEAVLQIIYSEAIQLPHRSIWLPGGSLPPRPKLPLSYPGGASAVAKAS